MHASRFGDHGDLTPLGVETLTLPDRVLDVPKCRLQFRPWRGSVIEDTYGDKAVVEFEGEPLFAELAVLRLFQHAGWDGVWVDGFGRRFRTGLPGRVPPVEPPEPARLVYQAIANVAGRRAGCWDVFVWRDGAHRFAELKRVGKDRIRPSQIRWLDAALRAGFTADAFLLVEWDLA